ncbi:hypothetical protein E3N88_08445 [Mikania micrantha]|uniref:Uncharacterized protein n=1 Tax=Mikania micrantha TaxID=192012 RepID=A0A5N6PG89_9ASTR|nr:hypothetical protein E3N88_08445 [Mikania micrantha]
MVNLVFSCYFFSSKCEPIILGYRLQGETKTSVSYLAYEIEDGMWACELFQFTSDSQFVDLEILFEGFDEYYESIFVQGIEFRPIEKVEHKDDNQTISDSDAYCEEELPADYEDIMKWSTDIMQWTTKKEAYSIIRKGFLIDDAHFMTPRLNIALFLGLFKYLSSTRPDSSFIVNRLSHFMHALTSQHWIALKRSSKVSPRNLFLIVSISDAIPHSHFMLSLMQIGLVIKTPTEALHVIGCILVQTQSLVAPKDKAPLLEAQ